MPAAAAHDDPGHEGDIGLAVEGNRVVEQVFDTVYLVHEGVVAAVLEHCAHVASGAECARPRSPHENRADRRIVAPDIQLA